MPALLSLFWIILLNSPNFIHCMDNMITEMIYNSFHLHLIYNIIITCMTNAGPNSTVNLVSKKIDLNNKILNYLIEFK